MKKKVSIGMIGVNGRGRFWRYIHNPKENVFVTAGADHSDFALKYFKEHCNNDAFITKDYNDLLNNPSIDGIMIMTPDRFHVEHVVAALKSGKFVYCEKPMAITLEDCDTILKTSNLYPNKLMIGFNMRYMPFVLKMKEIVDSGEIGEIKAVWVRHFVGLGSAYYYHTWCGLKDKTSSLLLQKGSHDIDVVHFVTGHHAVKAVAFGDLDFFGGNEENNLECANCPKNESCIDALKNFYEPERKPDRRFCAFRKEVDMPDNYTCLFQLDNGIKFSYNECHFTPDYHRNYTFIGTKGRIENSEIESTIKVWHRKHGRNDNADRIINVNECLSEKDLEIGHGGADVLIANDFVKMIRGEISAPVSPLAGRQAVAAGLAAQKSLENGGKIINIEDFDNDR